LPYLLAIYRTHLFHIPIAKNEAKSSTIEGRFEVLLSYVERRSRDKNLNHTLTKNYFWRNGMNKKVNVIIQGLLCPKGLMIIS
tara:strand:+ start:38 stop:286 length:249 start_codon:yes stop_codon:yes gene_type:complete